MKPKPKDIHREKFREYYPQEKIKEIRANDLTTRRRKDIYAVFKHEDGVYVRVSDVVTISDADIILRKLRKEHPKTKFCIFTERAACYASKPEKR